MQWDVKLQRHAASSYLMQSTHAQWSLKWTKHKHTRTLERARPLIATAHKNQKCTRQLNASALSKDVTHEITHPKVCCLKKLPNCYIYRQIYSWISRALAQEHLELAFVRMSFCFVLFWQGGPVPNFFCFVLFWWGGPVPNSVLGIQHI